MPDKKYVLVGSGGQPELGYVAEYRAGRGFGFLIDALDGTRSFFHIKEVKDKLLRANIEAQALDCAATILCYVLQHTERGYAALSIRPYPDMAFRTHEADYAKRIVPALVRSNRTYSAKDLGNWIQLLKNHELSVEEWQALLCSPFTGYNLKILRGLIPDAVLVHLKTRIKVQELWYELSCASPARLPPHETFGVHLDLADDLTSSPPTWLPPVTVLLYGEEELGRLMDERARAEVKRESLRSDAEESSRRELQEIHAGKKQKALAAQVSKYRTDPTGIRNDFGLREVCLRCGTPNAEVLEVKFGDNRACSLCGESWYVNHCWSCSVSRVDSRDPATPKCPVCGWYKCSKCGACKKIGCVTNPYNRHHRFVDVEHGGEDFDMECDIPF